MTAQQLKNSILQMAVQGKLVPQDPNDEPASVLLERIRAEKEQLIKEKKIKKEKNPSVIFRGADNLPYEKVGKNEPVCIADAIPFDVPDSWEWVRLGHVCEIARGGSPRPIKAFLTEDPNGINWIKIGDTDKGGKYINSTKERIIPEGVSKSRMVHAGDFLLTNSMSFGRPYILNVDGCIHDGWLVLSEYNRAYDQDFLFHMLSSRFAYFQFCDVVSGAVVKNLNSDKVAAALFPLPPLSEQKRIVEAIESVIPSVNEYDAAESLLRNLNSTFPDRLKKSILQWAIQGKLVPQDPMDEPAEVLLARIREEKKRLIKEGKIKKDKHESIIFRRDNSHYEKLDGTEYCIDNELPFEIPENWCWVRLRSIVYNRGQATPNTAFCYIDIGSIDNKNQKLNAAETIIFPDKAPSRARKLVDKGDILYSTVRPYLHNMCIIDREFSQVPIASTGFAVLACHTGLLNKFLFYYMMSPDFDAYANNTDNAKGVAYPAISDARLYKALIPLPPFSEQQRIIQRIDELLPLVKGL